MRVVLASGCAAFSLMCASPIALAQSAVPPPLYRIVLTDGSSVDAYGEWVRVGERVIFSLALDPQRDPPALHLSSLPADRVDFVATERYRDALRAATYAATRGDIDFDTLSADVAKLLSDAAQASDGATKLALAERARALLADWPSAHHGYRADEVRQIHALVDEVVADLRATRGDTAFDLSLVAQVMPPPSVPLAPPPTLRDSIAQALGVARLAESSVERVSLLRAAGTLARRSAAGDANDPGLIGLTREIDTALARELRVDAAYAAFRSRTVAEAMRAAARADVKAVERVVTRARKRDADLGGLRPDVAREVNDTLDRYLETARTLRLARDQWNARKSVIAAYRDQVGPMLRALDRARGALDDVRSFSGPSVKVLTKTEGSLREAEATLRRGVVPDEVRAAHAVVLGAAQLATNALRLRRDAISTADMQRARDASAAAAGALMMSARARDDVERALKPPTLQ